MKLHVVSIYDIAAAMYSRPAFVTSRAAAVRSFGDEVRRSAEGNELNKHPQDFELRYLGQFDDESGRFDCVEPERISLGIDHTV